MSVEAVAYYTKYLNNNGVLMGSEKEFENVYEKLRSLCHATLERDAEAPFLSDSERSLLAAALQSLARSIELSQQTQMILSNIHRIYMNPELRADAVNRLSANLHAQADCASEWTAIGLALMNSNALPHMQDIFHNLRKTQMSAVDMLRNQHGFLNEADSAGQLLSLMTQPATYMVMMGLQYDELNKFMRRQDKPADKADLIKKLKANMGLPEVGPLDKTSQKIIDFHVSLIDRFEVSKQDDTFKAEFTTPVVAASQSAGNVFNQQEGALNQAYLRIYIDDITPLIQATKGRAARNALWQEVLRNIGHIDKHGNLTMSAEKVGKILQSLSPQAFEQANEAIIQNVVLRQTVPVTDMQRTDMRAESYRNYHDALSKYLKVGRFQRQKMLSSEEVAHLLRTLVDPTIKIEQSSVSIEDSDMSKMTVDAKDTDGLKRPYSGVPDAEEALPEYSQESRTSVSRLSTILEEQTTAPTTIPPESTLPFEVSDEEWAAADAYFKANPDSHKFSKKAEGRGYDKNAPQGHSFLQLDVLDTLGDTVGKRVFAVPNAALHKAERDAAKEAAAESNEDFKQVYKGKHAQEGDIGGGGNAKTTRGIMRDESGQKQVVALRKVAITGANPRKEEATRLQVELGYKVADRVVTYDKERQVAKRHLQGKRKGQYKTPIEMRRRDKSPRSNEMMYEAVQLAPGSNLEKYIKSKHSSEVGSDKRIPDEDRLIIAQAVLETVKGYHDRNILHRDLKSENMMIELNGLSGAQDGPPVVHLIDNDALMDVSIEPVRVDVTGPITGAYAAPELQVMAKRFSKASDRYALGQILLADLDLRGIHSDLDEVINGLLSDDPQMRPDLEVVEVVLARALQALQQTQSVTDAEVDLGLSDVIPVEDDIQSAVDVGQQNVISQYQKSLDRDDSGVVSDFTPDDDSDAEESSSQAPKSP